MDVHTVHTTQRQRSTRVRIYLRVDGNAWYVVGVDRRPDVAEQQLANN